MKNTAKKSLAAALAVLALGAASSWAKGKSVVVEDEACIAYNKAQTGEWHAGQIKRQLYAKAMDKHVCASVRARFLDIMQSVDGRDAQFVEQNISLMQDAQVFNVEVLAEGFREGSGYCAKARFEILPLPCDKVDHDFEASASVSSKYVKEGESVVITASATRDAYFYVFSVAGDRANALMPHPLLGEGTHFRKAGEEVRIPPPGRKVTASLPEGRDESSEYIRVVAVKENVALFGKAKKGAAPPDEIPLEEVLRGLARLSPDLWTSATTEYTVHK